VTAAEHVAQARAMLGEAASLDAEDRGTHEDLSFLLEANAHAILALVDAISAMTEQAAPTAGQLRVRAFEEVPS
jgi:hypothetical protein